MQTETTSVPTLSRTAIKRQRYAADPTIAPYTGPTRDETPGYRSPGRRGTNATLYRYAPLPFETHLTGDETYRGIRYEVERAERKLAILQNRHAGKTIVEAACKRIEDAKMAQLRYLMEHRPANEAEEPVELVREFNADGELTAETETAVRGAA